MLIKPAPPQRLCKRLLESQASMDVTLADDGDVALRALVDSYGPGGVPFNLCLMDLQMPRMGGLQATLQFRAFESDAGAQQPRLPVIALSANVFEETAVRCKEAGMDGFVPKPLRLNLLREALKSHLVI